MSKKKPVTVDLFDGSYEEDQQAILDGLEAARRNHPVDPDEEKLLDLLSMYDKIHPSKFDFEKETWLPSQSVMLVPQGKDALDVIAAPYYKEPLFPFTDEQLEELNADKILEPLYEKILSIFDDNATLPFLGKGFQNIKARVAALDWKKIETYFNEKALVRVNELTMQAHTGRAQAADDLPRLCNTVKLFASLYAWQELFRLTEAQQDLEEAAEKGKDVTAACVDLSTELKKVGHSIDIFKLTAITQYTGMSPYLIRLKKDAPELYTEADEWAQASITRAFLHRTPWFAEWERKQREAKKKPLPVIRTTKPTERTDPTDKISGLLTEDAIFDLDEPQGIALERKGSKNKITALVNIKPDKTIAETLDGLDQMDKIVLNAVYAIHLAENNVMTTKQIYNAMTGGNGGEPSKKTLDEIDRRLSKLIHTAVFMDLTAEAEALGHDKHKKFVIEDNILPARKATLNINGRETVAFALDRTPPLLWYAGEKNQICRYPMQMLDVPVRNSHDNIILKNYLAYRISSNLPPTIVYDTLYSQLGELGSTQGAARVKEKKIREAVAKIMDAYKKAGRVKSWTENKKGRKFYSISFVKGKG